MWLFLIACTAIVDQQQHVASDLGQHLHLSVHKYVVSTFGNRVGFEQTSLLKHNVCNTIRTPFSKADTFKPEMLVNFSIETTGNRKALITDEFIFDFLTREQVLFVY